MPVKISAPITSGNQPPCAIFNRLAEKNTASITKKKPVAASAGSSLNFHAWRST